MSYKSDSDILADDTINLEYHALLEKSRVTDFTDLQNSGCINVLENDDKCPVILFLPKLGLNCEVGLNESNNGGDASTINLKRMLLLFIRTAHDFVHSDYIVVYGNTPLSLLSQHPVIYQYYKLLPRQYKKNLKKLYILHPQIGIRMFFELSRVFLSHKFYSKLVLCEYIAELQSQLPRIIPIIPHRFIKAEDDDKGYKFKGPIPPLSASFVPLLGTSKLIADCTNYIRDNKGFQREGLFRIAGDEVSLSLAKVRLQANLPGISSSASCSSPAGNAFLVNSRVLIGEYDLTRMVESVDKSPNIVSATSAPTSNSGNSTEKGRVDKSLKKSITDVLSGRRGSMISPAASSSSSPLAVAPSQSETTVVPPVSTATSTLASVYFNEIDTVAQILKFSLRELPEPLITSVAYQQLMEITDQLKQKSSRYSTSQWEKDVKDIINAMPIEHKASLNHLLYFLAEVASHSDANLMDSANLGMIFAPTIMRSVAEDHSKMLSEIGYSKTVVVHLINTFKDFFPNSKPQSQTEPTENSSGTAPLPSGGDESHVMTRDQSSSSKQQTNCADNILWTPNPLEEYHRQSTQLKHMRLSESLQLSEVQSEVSEAPERGSEAEMSALEFIEQGLSGTMKDRLQRGFSRQRSSARNVLSDHAIGEVPH